MIGAPVDFRDVMVAGILGDSHERRLEDQVLLFRLLGEIDPLKTPQMQQPSSSESLHASNCCCWTVLRALSDTDYPELAASRPGLRPSRGPSSTACPAVSRRGC